MFLSLFRMASQYSMPHRLPKTVMQAVSLHRDFPFSPKYPQDRVVSFETLTAFSLLLPELFNRFLILSNINVSPFPIAIQSNMPHVLIRTVLQAVSLHHML